MRIAANQHRATAGLAGGIDAGIGFYFDFRCGNDNRAALASAIGRTGHAICCQLYGLRTL